MTWDQFKAVLFREYAVFPRMSHTSVRKFKTAIAHIDRILQPIELSDITIRSGSTYVAALRESGKSVATMKTYLTVLQTAMGWAYEQGYRTDNLSYKDRSLKQCSNRLRRGRAISEAEMASLVGLSAGEPAWQWLVVGLYLSGLRISEAVKLTWDRTSAFSVDMTREFPAFLIQQGGDKAGIERVCPMAPDFAEALKAIPLSQRHGYVFSATRSDEYAQHKIAGYMRSANLTVTRHPKVKFCTAHDLRRSFGTRWAMKVSAPVLREMMRHSSLKVTEQYYIDLRCDEVSRYLWTLWVKESPVPVVSSFPEPLFEQPAPALSSTLTIGVDLV